jgi:hypothetical protein
MKMSQLECNVMTHKHRRAIQILSYKQRAQWHGMVTHGEVTATKTVKWTWSRHRQILTGQQCQKRPAAMEGHLGGCVVRF